MTDISPFLSDAALKTAYRSAAARFEADLRERAPYTYDQVGPWIYQGLPEGDLTEDWTKPRGFPLLVLPRWFLDTVGTPVDPDFLADLDYSSVNGYYFVRLIDQVMDGELEFDPRIVVASAFFHSRFQGVFHRHFSGASGFWPSFQRSWDDYVEITMRDAFLERIDEPTFRAVTGRKFVAAKIPLAAAAYHVGAEARLDSWLAVLDPLGRWQQMVNDLFDWYYDRDHGTCTFIQSEAERRAPGEPPDVWFTREGFNWARDLIDQFHREAVAAIEPLGSRPMEQYLTQRKLEVDLDLDAAAEGVSALATLVRALG